MEETLEKNLSAENLRQIINKNQIRLVYDKIMEAAKNFKQDAYIRTDFKLTEKTIYYFKNLGYKVLIDYDVTLAPYKYSYEISWK